ncbi:hypothetical protein NDU88_007509 [Pleurodeles waltl]|uniref:Uncharacterized protein n=1 Tax=Pleurodeles waltl TaxID=8319 RepID=A0AAV7VR06_PLEWA|nr:hypothetical protein NDU88_007509 [Pleurodeles waltl]
MDQSAPGRPRNFNFISLWRAAEVQSIAPSQAGHGKMNKHLPVRSDKKVGQHWVKVLRMHFNSQKNRKLSLDAPSSNSVQRTPCT